MDVLCRTPEYIHIGKVTGNGDERSGGKKASEIGISVQMPGQSQQGSVVPYP